MKVEKQNFEIIGKDVNSNLTTQFSVLAVDPSDAKKKVYKNKPNFNIKIIYPSRFDEVKQYCSE